MNDVSLIKGTVVSDYTMDPKQLKRVQVYIPALHGGFKTEMVGTTDNENEHKYPWAQCSVSGGLENIPKSGSTVWIIFETDNSEFPVVIGSHTAALTENSSSEGTGIAGGSLAEIAAQIIFGNEGGYDSVNWNDNGAISIGKIQWHANKARNLLKEIREKNSGSFDSTCNGCTLVSDLSKDWGSWRNWSAGCPCGIALKSVLKTNESKQVQDQKALEYVQDYISNIQKKGVTDAKCIIYLADIANQGPAYAYEMAGRAAAAGCNSLDALHAATRECKFGRYGWINDSRGMPRRNRTYQAIIKAEQEGKFTENNLTNMAGQTGNGQLGWPAPGIKRITSNYGYRGAISGTSHTGTNFHNGIDIGTPTGTTIVASADGIVTVSAFNSGGYGHYVVIKHPSLNLRTLYAHGTQRLVNVGQTVKRGDAILKSGSTGNSSGPHLHYTVATGTEAGTQNMGSSRYGAQNSKNPLLYVQKP